MLGETIYQEITPGMNGNPFGLTERCIMSKKIDKPPVVVDVVVCGVCGGIIPMDKYDCRCPEWNPKIDRKAKFIGRLKYEKQTQG